MTLYNKIYGNSLVEVEVVLWDGKFNTKWALEELTGLSINVDPLDTTKDILVGDVMVPTGYYIGKYEWGECYVCSSQAFGETHIRL